MADVTDREVIEVLLEALNLSDEYEVDDIAADGQLFGEDGLGLDSLDALQLAVAIEEKFGVQINEEEGATVFLSVRSIVERIRKG